MRSRATLRIILFAAISSIAVGQTVTGTGTSGTVPRFTGSSTIGNSPIVVTGSNVGIGATSPAVALQVAGSGTEAVRVGGSNGTRLVLQAGANDSTHVNWELGVQDHVSNAFEITQSTVVGGYTFATPTVVVNSSGNVGVGTTNPASLLHLMPSDANSNDFSTGIRVSRAESSPVDQYVSLNFAQGVANLVSAGHLDYGYFQFQQYNGSAYRVAMGINNLGNVGIGTTSPGVKLDVVGQVRTSGGVIYPDSTQQTTAWTGVLCGGDYAEDMNAAGGKASYGPGDVLVLTSEEEGDVKKSAEPYSRLVAGIYATRPGVIGRREAVSKSTENIPMAMLGVVPTKVSAENGPIRRGDLLVTSSTAGYAMKGTEPNRLVGAVIGKAMGRLDSGTGVIEVLVTLQ